jgi:modulator of FtsH protease HflC
VRLRRTIIYAVAVIFAVALLSRMAAYTVRFTEAAVLTTFGKADPESSVKRAPGLYLKWPQPIQSVTKYDTRARFVESRLEQQQTADDRLVVVEPYCTWRVDDPLVFFQRFSSQGERAADHYKAAERAVLDYLRSAAGGTSRYRMTDLFTTGGEGSKIPELEKRMSDSMTGSELVSSRAIAIVDVGISRIILPEATTTEVFNTIRADRNRLIKNLETQGEAEASKIISNAERDAARIREFARAYAAEIRQRGDEEASVYMAQMNESPELAIFLKNVEFIRELVAKRITLIFDTGMPGFEALSPRAVNDAEHGVIPGVERWMRDVASRNGGRPAVESAPPARPPEEKP